MPDDVHTPTGTTDLAAASDGADSTTRQQQQGAVPAGAAPVAVPEPAHVSAPTAPVSQQIVASVPSSIAPVAAPMPVAKTQTTPPLPATQPASGVPMPATPTSAPIPTPPPTPNTLPEQDDVPDVGLALAKPPNTPDTAPHMAPAVEAALTQPALDKKEVRDIHTDIARILQEVKLPERARRRPAAPPQSIPLTPDTAAMTQATVTTPADIAAAASTPAKPENIPDVGLVIPKPVPAPAYMPPPTKQDEPATSEPEHIDPKQRVTSVHTLKQDLQEVVRTQKISLVRAAAIEQDKGRARDTKIAPTPAAQNRSRRTAGILFATFILFFLGAAALFGVYIVTQQRTAPAERISGPSLIFAEQEAALPLTNQSTDAVKRTVAQARNAQTGALGSITRIVPLEDSVDAQGNATQRPATLTEFFSAAGITPPDELMRSLGSDFFFGFHTIDTTVPLLVIPVTSYSHAFAGMLVWEKTMDPDLAPMFTAVPMMTTDSNGLPLERTFGDYVLRNYDIRALKDDAGAIRLYYSFPTPSILVIAESPYTFTEILSRLQASRNL